MASRSKKLLKRLRGAGHAVVETARDADDWIDEQNERARRWMEANAPALVQAGGSAARVGRTFETLRSGSALAHALGAEAAPGLPYRGNPANQALAFQQDVAATGQKTVLEPLVYGARHLAGADPEGGPFSGRNIQEAEAELDRLPLLPRLGGRAALAAGQMLTDPTSYLPGVGVGGRTAGTVLRRAAGTGALMEVGRQAGGRVAEEVGAPRAYGEAGGLLIGGVGGGAAVNRAFRDAPKAGRGATGAVPATLDLAPPAPSRPRQVLDRLRGGGPDEAGRLGTGTALRAGAIAAGAGVGYLEGDTTEERLRGAAIGAGIAGGAVFGAKLATARRSRRALNTIIQPADNWGPDAKAIARHHEGANLAGRMEVIERAKPAIKSLEQEVLAVLPDAPPPGSPQAARLAGLRGDALAAERRFGWKNVAEMIEAETHDPAAWNWYLPHLRANPRALAAYEEIKRFGQAFTDWEIQNGRWGNNPALLDGYVPHVFGRDPVGPGTAYFNVGGKSWYQNERTFPTYRAARIAGFLPASESVADLMEYRMLSGVGAVADLKAVREVIGLPGGIITNFDPRFPTKDTKSGYVHLNIDDHTKLALPPDVRAQLKDEALAAVRTAYGGTAPPHVEAAIARGDLAFAVPEDVHEALQVLFARDTVLGEHAIPRAVKTGIDNLRLLDLAGDFYMGTRSLVVASAATIQGLTSARPSARGFGVLWDGVHAMVSPRYFDDFMDTHFPRRQFWAKAQLGMSPSAADSAIFETPIDSTWVERASKSRVGTALLIPRLMLAVEHATMGRMIPVMKIKMADTYLAAMRAAYPGESEDKLAIGVANMVDAMFGGLSRVKAGITRNRQDVEALALYTPRFQRALANLALKYPMRGGGPGNVEGVLARGFWGRGVVGLGAATIAGSLAMIVADDHANGRLRDPEYYLTTYLDPRSPDSLINPASPNFGKIVTPGGTRIELLGNLRSSLAILDRPVARAVGKAAEARERGDGTIAMLGAALDGFATMLPEAAKFADARMNPLLRVPSVLANDAPTDYRDRAVTQEEDWWWQWRDKFFYLAQGLLPGVVEAWAPDERPLAVQLGPEREVGVESAGRGLQKMAGQFTGLFVSLPEERNREAVKAAERFLLEHGVEPGLSPLARLAVTDEIPRYQKDEFLAANPLVREDQQRRATDRAGRLAKPVGKGAITLYDGAVARARKERDEGLRVLNTEMAGGGMSGNDYRARRGQILSAYSAAVNAYAKSYLNVKDASEAFALKQTRRGDAGKKPEDAVDQAIELLYTIEPADGSPDSLRAYSQRRGEFLRTGVLDGQALVSAETMARVREHLVRRQQHPVEQQYQEAAALMGEYMAQSPYHGLTVAQAQTVQDALDRGRQRIRLTGMGKLKYEVLKDPRLDRETRLLAYRAARGKLRPNRERRQFYQQHADVLGRFYSDLVEQELMALVEAA